MARRKDKNEVVLTTRKLNYTYSLNDEQLDEFLNKFLDYIIINEVDEPQTMIKICTSKEGIILSEGITQQCHDTLSRYLNEI